MSSQIDQPQTADEQAIIALYYDLLTQWNEQNAAGIAALYSEQGNCVGFDGSQIDGRGAVEQTMSQIFANHRTGAYVGKVREVRFLTAETALLRAVVGMIPPGQNEINPAVNAIQSLVVVKCSGQWQIELFHNTPAAFHGRPQLSEQLSAELRELLT